MSSAKKSSVSSLHASFQQLLKQELDMYLGNALDEEGKPLPPIPMAAADKSVFLAWFKLNNVTADPDSDASKGLAAAFSEAVDEKRKARAALLTSVTAEDDVLKQFTH